MKKILIPALATVVLVGGISVVALTNTPAAAVVNGTKISQAEIDERLAGIPTENVSDMAQLKKDILERLIEQELILQDAEKRNVYNKNEFKEQLELAKENLAFNFTVQEVIDSEITDATLEAEYERLKPSLSYPIVRARHILVETEEAAKKLITELDKGADFEQLAKEESTGPSAENGGDLGYFRQQDMVPEFATAAFALETGSYSKEPVQTQFGWHVIKAEDRKIAQPPAFEAVSATLRQNLSQQAVQAYVQKLREEAEIKYAE